jgi:hypothetical protein
VYPANRILIKGWAPEHTPNTLIILVHFVFIRIRKRTNEKVKINAKVILRIYEFSSKKQRILTFFIQISLEQKQPLLWELYEENN